MALKVTVRPAASVASAIEVRPATEKEVEAIFKQLTDEPGSEAFLDFVDKDGKPDEKELTRWSREARAYCKTRKAGALRFRQLPSKELPPHQMRVNITNDLEENGDRAGRRAVR
jgi:hypothetical protein